MKRVPHVGTNACTGGLKVIEESGIPSVLHALDFLDFRWVFP